MSQDKDLVTLIRESLASKKQASRENLSQTEAPIKVQPLMTGSENPKPTGQPQQDKTRNTPASMRPKNMRG